MRSCGAHKTEIPVILSTRFVRILSTKISELTQRDESEFSHLFSDSIPEDFEAPVILHSSLIAIIYVIGFQTAQMFNKKVIIAVPLLGAFNRTQQTL